MVLNLFKFLTPSTSRGGAIKAQTRQNVTQEWQKISVLVEQKGPSQLRQALISADKSLDNVLRDKVAGEAMGERLKNAKDLFDRTMYDKIWQAHKMRNALVHESGYEPPHHMLTNGIETLKQAIISLGVGLR